MGNFNHSVQDQPLIPLLYIENITEIQIEVICRQFLLISEKKSSGYLIRSKEPHPNFKISFLDLFFAALSSFAHHPGTTFLLFEKNLLREELESSILGAITQETMVENKISEWKSKKRNFSLSGFAQAALHQVGLVSVIETEEQELSLKQLSQILDTNLSHKVKTNKVA
jgi:hypothetical protein